MPQPDYEDDLVFPPQERLAELSKTVENLSSENHRLLNLTANQDKEIETLKEDQEKMVRGAKRMLDFQSQIIEQLRQLLKECQTFFEEENPKDFTVLSERMEDLLTKINEVMK